MKIGISGSFVGDSEGIQYVFDVVLRGLHENSEYTVVRLPPSYRGAQTSDKQKLAKEFLTSVDVVIGLVDNYLLIERLKLPKKPTCLFFVLGWFPRGALGLEALEGLLLPTDVLLCNSTADKRLISKFIHNINVRVLYFPCESVFFDLKLSKASARKALRISNDAKVVLYTGRISLEKNIHSLLKVFCSVRKEVPNAKLLIAGRFIDNEFYEFGIKPVNYENTIKRIVDNYKLQGSVIFLGLQSRWLLAHYYRAADVFVSISLHHDENFGFSPVEAMASGLPTVTTAWGGFRDTVKSGQTGYHVPVHVASQTPIVDLPYAIAIISRVLMDESLKSEMQVQSLKRATQLFTESKFFFNLYRVISEVNTSDRVIAEVKFSRFAHELWSHRSRGIYKNSSIGRALYREIIQIYAFSGVATRTRTNLCITGFCKVSGDKLIVEHPLFIGRYRVPDSLLADIRHTLEIVKQQQGMLKAEGNRQDNVPRAIVNWLVTAGAIGPTRVDVDNGCYLFEKRLLFEKDLNHMKWVVGEL